MQLRALRLRPAPPRQPGQDLPDPAAVRRGPRAPQGRPPAAGGRAGGGLLMGAGTLDVHDRARRAAPRPAPRSATAGADGADDVDGVRPGLVARPDRRRRRWPRCCAPRPPTGSPSCRAARGTKLAWGAAADLGRPAAGRRRPRPGPRPRRRRPHRRRPGRDPARRRCRTRRRRGPAAGPRRDRAGRHHRRHPRHRRRRAPRGSSSAPRATC